MMLGKYMTFENKKRGEGPDPIDRLVGKNLKLFRTAAGMSQTEVAQKVGITFQQFQKYERGQNRVSAGRLYKFACILGMGSVDLFYRGLGDIPHGHAPQDENDAEAMAAFRKIPKALRGKLVKLMEAMENVE